ncbi:flagellin [Spirochaeta africana]|uniref:Flagellin n=1 Tax=Spirochaeta africana (strain ATCC 700263 / DSM 8902 / Z-7692) TaxID=889378 RepID=H9UHA6_SPIAZ|nr:flagellin [Spirochaeta africana]AFG36899.1 flagellin/flagellar hook associated protein [Spirochaeta africana DSM 8902]
MIINHNASAAFANRELSFRGTQTQQNIEKLSSGMRINRAADDASGLAVSEKMRGQIRGLNQAERNVQNAVSFIQTTEGYLNQTQDILHRIRELSVQSANGIYTAEDRMQIQVEVSQLVDEVNRIASHAQFNGMNMLTGAFAADSVTEQVMQFHIGANMDQNERVYIGTMTAAALGLMDAQGENGVISISTPESANNAIGAIDTAMQAVSRQRADLGAYQNRFQMAQQGIATASENLAAAESLIRDTDMAQEMVGFVRNQILTQSNQAMLAQANVMPQGVLQLLG